MPPPCGHPLCALIGGACALAMGRSRGCGARPVGRGTAPEVFDEVRGLLGVLDAAAGGDGVREAAVRLAGIIRREALEDRVLLAQARIDEPELVPALERLCLRQR